MRCLVFAIGLALLAMRPVAADPPIQRLTELQQQAHQHLADGNAQGAFEVAGKILEACAAREAEDNSERFARNDPQRIQFLMFAARLDMGIGNLPRALKTFSEIISDSAAGSANRLMAQAFTIQIKSASGQPCTDEAIDLLDDSSSLDDANQALRDDLQVQAVNALLIAIAADPAQLSATVADIDERMGTRDIPLGVARLTRFAQVAQANKQGDLKLVALTLDSLANSVAAPQVATYWRMRYWNSLADLHQQRRHFADAFDACDKFSRLAQQAGRKDMVLLALEQSALVALRIGDYAEARKRLEQTAALHEGSLPPPPDLFDRLDRDVQWSVNLAKAIEGENEYVTAQRRLEAALRLVQPHREGLGESVALVENNLGINHYLQGNFDLADEFVGRATETIQAAGASPVRLGETDINAGWIAMARNDLPAAAKRFADAARRFGMALSSKHPRYAEALTYQARVAAQQGDITQAIRWLEDAERLVYRRVCRDLASSGSTRDQIAIVQEARVHPESIAWPGTIDTYLELAPRLKIPVKQQYDVVLRWKGLIQRFDRHRNVEETEQERKLTQDLRKVLFRSVTRSKRRAWLEEVVQYESALRTLRRNQQNRRLREVEIDEVDSSSVAGKLQPGDCFLDLFQYRTFAQPTGQGLIGSAQKYVAFTLDDRGNVKRLDLGPVTEIDAAVVRWYEIIIDRQFELNEPELLDHQKQLDQAARQLAGLIQAPLLNGPTFNQLHVRADGATHLIPWAALPGTDDSKYWVENVCFVMCDSAGPSDLAPIKDPPSLFAVGGVDFGDLRYSELTGSFKEQQLVLTMFRDRYVKATAVDLHAEAASESALQRELTGKDFIHLATHGIYRRGDQSNAFAVAGATSLEQIGLVVAPPAPNELQHDQYLTAAEIGRIDLSGTSLAILSACESSLGQTLAGQGVQGMFGSFHAAGANRVIGSLWEINDASTTDFMKSLYQHLWNQQLPPAEALRAAQLEMLASDDELLAHPYAWAAFICSAK